MSVLLGILASTITRAEVIAYPAPAGEALSQNYEIHADGKKVDVYTARTLDPPFAGKEWDFGGSYAFANFDTSGSVRVRITSKKSLRNTVVRPQSPGVRLKVEDDHTVELALDGPHKVSIEPDGKRGPLLLFANPIEQSIPKAGDRGVLFFGPGVHRPGRIDVASGQTVYLAGGAVVRIVGHHVQGITLAKGDTATVHGDRHDSRRGGEVALEKEPRRRENGTLPFGHATSPDAFRPGEVWLDSRGAAINAHGGGILSHEGTFYWFGQHMVEGEAGNYAQVGVHVYASKNLSDWHDEGIALRVSEDPKSDITKGCVLERPKVIYNRKTGKFVMWFHLELKGKGYRAARSGVAIADCPTGPYRFSESFRPNAGAWPRNVPEELKKPLTADESAQLRNYHLDGGPVPHFPENLIFRRDFAGGQMARDMTLFVDDDGIAYHIYASEDNGTLQISQLTDDYLRPAGKYVRALSGGFNEAPAMFKHGRRYYLITSGCTSWTPNSARLAVADSVWGPWKALGNPCVGNDAGLTFHGQATYVLPLPSKPGALIFMADRWQPENAIDGRYLWLPIQFKDGRPFIQWTDRWNLEFFDRTTADRRTKF